MLDDTITEKCEYHRTIRLITHVSKILTKIIDNRIEVKINNNLEKNQFILKRNRETRKTILCLDDHV